MEIITQYEIPFLHPLVVHFPLVLILLGAAVAGLYLLFGSRALRVAGLTLFVLATASAWFAQETGPALYRAVEGDPLVEEVIEAHRDGASWTVWTSAFAMLAFGVVSAARLRPRRRPAAAAGEGAEAPAPEPRRPRREPLWGRLLVAVLAFAAAAFVAWTAHLGGLMVWGVPR